MLAHPLVFKLQVKVLSVQPYSHPPSLWWNCLIGCSDKLRLLIEVEPVDREPKNVSLFFISNISALSFLTSSFAICLSSLSCLLAPPPDSTTSPTSLHQQLCQTRAQNKPLSPLAHKTPISRLRKPASQSKYPSWSLTSSGTWFPEPELYLGFLETIYPGESVIVASKEHPSHFTGLHATLSLAYAKAKAGITPNGKWPAKELEEMRLKWVKLIDTYKGAGKGAGTHTIVFTHQELANGLLQPAAPFCKQTQIEVISSACFQCLYLLPIKNQQLCWADGAARRKLTQAVVMARGGWFLVGLFLFFLNHGG
ncbi:hypothetical protein T439DRAFT_337821 [Meredithblackwellia eburnea MCA 4105]